MRILILSAILAAASSIAAPQSANAQNRPFCLRSPTGALNCTYDSWEQCEQFIRGRTVGGGCVENPQIIFGSDSEVRAQRGKKVQKSKSQ
jgi:Protein of unknown function (DUF3551)